MTVRMSSPDWDYAVPPAASPWLPSTFGVSGLAHYFSQTISSINGQRVDNLPIDMNPVSVALPGVRMRSWPDDNLNRIHVGPTSIDFGNIIGNQARDISIWNAFEFTVTLNSIAGSGTDGMSLTSPGGTPPVALPGYGERTYTLTATPAGPPNVSASYSFAFGSDVRVVSIVGRRIIAWQWQPTWERGVLERLEWRTDAIRSFNGREQRRRLRSAPRQIIEFDVLITDRDRRTLETTVAGWQSRAWALPIWWSARAPSAQLNAGSTSISIDTAGSEFRAGGLALVLALDGSSEVAEVQSVGPSALTLVRPLIATWPTTSRVFPCVSARLDAQIPMQRFDGDTTYFRARMTALEPYTFTAAAPPTMFLGYPVLEQRALLPGELSVAMARKLEELDNGIGPTIVDDEAEIAFHQQSHGWLATTEAESITLRGLFYALAGRFGAVWLPTYMRDFRVVAPITAGATTFDVESMNFAQYAGIQPGRNHCCFILTNGQRVYQKITGASQVSATVERISVQTPFAANIALASIESVSFMALVRQTSDALELVHWTGQSLEVASSFVSFRHDL